MVKENKSNKVTVLRYKNRKFYAVKQGYVTLENILEMVGSGKELTVLNKGGQGEDITKATLMSALMQSETFLEQIEMEQIVDLIKTLNGNGSDSEELDSSAELA